MVGIRSVNMADTSDGNELVVEGNLGMVLEDDTVTLINSPCLSASSIILTDAVTNGPLNVSHYIIPQEVTGFAHHFNIRFIFNWYFVMITVYLM